MLPLVSVIVPTFEQENYAFQAALSALAQDYPRLEVVVVDDASPTATHLRLREIEDARLRFVRRPQNLGRTENYRQALRDLAKGEWALVLDGDDYFIDPRFISEAMVIASRDREIVMVAARTVADTGDRRMTSAHPGDCVAEGMNVLAALPDDRYFFQHLAVIYNRRLALQLDFYRSPVISSDWESLYRLASHGRVGFLDRVVGVWQIHGGNASGSVNPKALVANLTIWDSVYDEAVARGMPVELARARKAATVRFIIRQHIPKVARSWRDLRAYLDMANGDGRPVLAALCHPATMTRMALALLGYYGRG